MRLVIEYDTLDRKITIVENDFTTFEAFGILEATKLLVNE